MILKETILIVDDDAHILELLKARLSAGGFRVVTAPSGQQALTKLRNGRIDLLITDVRMPGMGGMDLLREVRLLQPKLPVILLTAYGNVPDAVEAMKAGAIDYLTKPFDGREVLKKIREVLDDGRDLPPLGGGAALSQVLIGGESASMQRLYDLVERVARGDVSVIILGESGVGKELIARIIHERGPRREHPFVVVDCGSTPSGLLESELFGHTRGAFTHAIRDKKGLIEAADGGTLFLDEVGNISPDMQVRLLRFLEDRKIRRIGDLQEIPVDCRVIAATNVDLPAEVEAGRFREDLYYRLRVLSLRVPPLRERKEDIPLLAGYFVKRASKRQGIPATELPPKTIAWLCEYPWPGNVRELKNAIEACVVVSKNGVLLPQDFHLTGLPSSPRRAEQGRGSFDIDENERELIRRALERSEWVQKDAAKLLGVSRRTLHYKIKKFGIRFPGKGA